MEYDGSRYLYKVNQMGDVLGLYDTTGKLAVKYRDAQSFRYRSYYYDTDTGMFRNAETVDVVL